MTTRLARNVAASVRQRLLNLAKERGEEFNVVLARYAVERFLYRLSRSKHRDLFVLDGFAVEGRDPLSVEAREHLARSRVGAATALSHAGPAARVVT